MPQTTTVEEARRSHAWFRLVGTTLDVEELAQMLLHSLRLAREEQRMLKISVQVVDKEDTF